jgi:hypothetical protein
VTGSPFADSIVYQRIDQRTIAGTMKKAGRTVMKEMVVISIDGLNMTNTYFGNSSEGSVVGFAVFDKQ